MPKTGGPIASEARQVKTRLNLKAQMCKGVEMSMRGLIPITLALLCAASSVPLVSAQPTTIEEFALQPETRWRFFTDGVMGGVSSGQLAFKQDDGRQYARMTGAVSTANRGGFIQMRFDLASPPPEGSTGVRLVVRGNHQ